MDLIQTQVSLSNIGGKKSMSKILKSFGIAVLMAALLVGTGMGQEDDTDSTDITAQVGSWINVTAPDEILTWGLGLGDNEYKSGDIYPQATIASNMANGSVYLKVHDARTPGTNPITLAGHMTNNADPAAATAELTAAMKVQANPASSGTQVTLGDTANTIYTLAAPSSANVDIGFSQNVGLSDVEGSYYMTVTFTGTVAT